jgi:hypothetical protein
VTVDMSARPVVAGAIKRYSNAHIVEQLEYLQRDVRELRRLLDPTASAAGVD